MTNSAITSRWSRRFVLTGAAFLVAWQLTLLAGLESRTGVVLGLFGFIFHTIFGKAYSLVPTYFDRTLAWPRLLPVHLVGSATGTVLIAMDAGWNYSLAGMVGASLWYGAVGIFLVTLFASIWDNPTGSETGTGDHNSHRADVDRRANLGIPVALGFLALGSYELLAVQTGLPPVFDEYRPRAFHLLATGTGALFVFAIGFRLLPRFFVATPPDRLVGVVIAAGAIGPLVLAVGLPAGTHLEYGAILQSIAVLGYATAIATLAVRTDRTRIGLYAVVIGAIAGVAGITLGLVFAFDGITADLRLAHLRLNLLGFLGLTIIGVSYQFYPPTVIDLPVPSNWVGGFVIGALALALGLETLGAITLSPLLTVGYVFATLGAIVHFGLLGIIFYAR